MTWGWRAGCVWGYLKTSKLKSGLVWLADVWTQSVAPAGPSSGFNEDAHAWLDQGFGIGGLCRVIVEIS
ncbi:hypothetical protein PF008_g8858 [Phytophthora fragariae]|uniref:Uncharacterized protein n=1 Tax=Phytophthora fragariae TaxID=53985 RepID=A0A6G0RZC1_9STRA|nr:hypothetical protein PF008_g8858 [Phytophthora fragariae]